MSRAVDQEFLCVFSDICANINHDALRLYSRYCARKCSDFTNARCRCRYQNRFTIYSAYCGHHFIYGTSPKGFRFYRHFFSLCIINRFFKRVYILLTNCGSRNGSINLVIRNICYFSLDISVTKRIFCNTPNFCLNRYFWYFRCIRNSDAYNISLCVKFYLVITLT